MMMMTFTLYCSRRTFEVLKSIEKEKNYYGMHSSASFFRNLVGFVLGVAFL
jgi:hypothetical protein